MTTRVLSHIFFFSSAITTRTYLTFPPNSCEFKIYMHLSKTPCNYGYTNRQKKSVYSFATACQLLYGHSKNCGHWTPQFFSHQSFKSTVFQWLVNLHNSRNKIDPNIFNFRASGLKISSENMYGDHNWCTNHNCSTIPEVL